MAMLLLEGFEGYADVDDNVSGGLCRGMAWAGDSLSIPDTGRYVDRDGRGLAKRFRGTYRGYTASIQSFQLSLTTATCGLAVYAAADADMVFQGAPAFLVDKSSYVGEGGETVSDLDLLFCRATISPQSNTACKRR